MALKVFSRPNDDDDTERDLSIVNRDAASDSRAQLLTITPLLAEAWLAKNDGNRNVRSRTIATYARDMTSGNWLVTGEAIKFDPSGRLIDGQHRLLAVIESGETIQSWVMWDVDPRAYVPMDSGATRTTYDLLKHFGYTDCANLAATAGNLVRYERFKNFRMGGHNQMSRAEVLQYVKDHPDLIESVKFGSGTPIPGLRRSLQSSLHYLFQFVDADDNDAFWSALRSGADLGPKSPILHLRNRLNDNATSTRKMGIHEESALVIKAWNAWREGKEMGALRFRPGGANPESFPEIK